MNFKLVALLRDARISSGLKQKDVAQLVGIKDNTLSNWETGRTEPDVDTFLVLCDIYNINAAEVLENAYGGKRTRTVFSDNESSIINAYRVASADDRAVVDAVLRKYMKAPNLTLIAARDGGLSTADASAISILGEEMQEDDDEL